MFNSISKRFKNDQNSPKQKNDQEMEGFICPICMASFKSPDLVQEHFDKNHEMENPKTDSILSPNTERKESIQNIQENFNDLKQSLDEEVWFNKELQKECGRLTNLLKEKEDESKADKETVDKYVVEIQELEKARDILTEELKKIQISRDSLIAENKTIRSDFRVCEQKTLDLMNNEKLLQEIIDIQKMDCETAKEELMTLKSNVESTNQRSAIDLSEINIKYEVNESLVKELKLEIDNIRSEQEKTGSEWKEKCSLLNETILKQATEKEELENDLKKWREKSESLQIDNQKLKQTLESTNRNLLETEDKFLQAKRSWSTDQTTLDNTLVKLNEESTERQKLKAANHDLLAKLKSRESEIMQLQSSLSTKEQDLITLSKTHKNLTEELEMAKQNLETETNEKVLLQSQVQMTDAANIVMEQLQSEKKNLQENIFSLKKQLEEEIKRNDSELSVLKSEIQTHNEKIYELNSSISEKDEQFADVSAKNVELMSNLDKYEKKIESELKTRSELEDKIVEMARDVKSKEEVTNSLNEDYNNLKIELEKSVKQFEKNEVKLKREISGLQNDLTELRKDAEMVLVLNEKIKSHDLKIESLETDLKLKNMELESLTTANRNLEREKENFQTEIITDQETISRLKITISEQSSDINCKSLEIKENKIQIENMNLQIDNETQLIHDQLNKLSHCEIKITELEQDIKQVNLSKEKLQDLLKESNDEQQKVLQDNSALKLEIEIIKKNLLEKEDTVASLVQHQQTIENELTETRISLKELQSSFEQAEKEKEETINELFLSKTEIDNVQQLYSESVKEQNECKTKLETVTEDFHSTKKRLKDVEENLTISQSEHARELDNLKKEENQLKNHVKTLTKTLNESSENYKQELLEAAEKEFSLNNQLTELQNSIENIKKSLQRTEEDLESEKNLRESERNNMMGKITQLSEHVATLENMRVDYEQKLEVVETENIENKLRLEMLNEEKEKLLEKIIQMENNLKKQTDFYSKKCKEFDQLQSAILDLGRENQSLQISKEKLTNRQWIGDVEAVECYTCHKLFSLTLRKHHCRNCGQVYCQDCSSKVATLAASRKPVRVCDGCYMEVQSHRRNSNISSSSVT